MTEEDLDRELLESLGNEHRAVECVRDAFGEGYDFAGWVSARGSPRPTFVDRKFQLSWVIVPAGRFRFGLSDEEWKAACNLHDPPWLTPGEMRPTRLVEVRAMLVLGTPLGRDVAVNVVPIAADGMGPGKAAVVGAEHAGRLAAAFDSELLTEEEWEYACRAGTESLFFFGDGLPDAAELERVLGMKEPVSPNGWGLKSLFFGEWTSSLWTTDLSAAPEPTSGAVIRGGAARFWPWQDSREWAGCASAYRMPARDAGDAGAAVRLKRVRR